MFGAFVPSRLPSRLAAAFLIALTAVVGTLHAPGAALAVVGSTTTLAVDNAAPAIGAPVTVTVGVVPSPGGGTVQLVENGTPIGDPLDLDASGRAVLTRTYAGTSPVSLSAQFSGFGDLDPSASSPLVVTPKYATTTVLTNDRNETIRMEQAVTFTAKVTAPGGPIPTGNVTFFTGTTALATRQLSNGVATYSINVLAVGSHTIRAKYVGSSTHLGSTSNYRVVIVKADTVVRATSIAVRYSTFYPIVDRYGDANVISGTLGEVATVLVRIYNPAGALVRSWDLPNRSVGAYSLTWNGKNQSGSLLPAGKYRVRTVVHDRSGNHIDISKYTNLSHAKVTVSVCGGVMDAPGNDNDNENGEYVILCNVGSLPANLTGWRLRDDAAHWYNFPSNFVLAAGSRVTVYTGSGTNTSARLYQRSGSAIWNNTGDCAYLYNYAGSLVSRRCWA